MARTPSESKSRLGITSVSSQGLLTSTAVSQDTGEQIGIEVMKYISAAGLARKESSNHKTTKERTMNSSPSSVIST
jgi:hypothetical protein